VFKITKPDLKNKILGGWTGKSYGAMMGEPMEFAAQGEIYDGSLDILQMHPRYGSITKMIFIQIWPFWRSCEIKDFMPARITSRIYFVTQNLCSGMPMGKPGRIFWRV